MPNTYFQFKQFIVHQEHCAMKVTTDACLFGAYLSRQAYDHFGPAPLKVLDIGTGTGLLALMFAQKNNTSQIDAVEIDASAATQATQNTAGSPWKERIQVVHADINDVEPAGKYDVIISNPPFYEKELKSDNAKKNTAHHDEGLLLPQLFGFITKYLDKSGRFYLLLPHKREQEAILLLNQHQLHPLEILRVRQSDQHGFFRSVITGTLQQTGASITTISITGAERNYTPAFTALLKDYYLKL